MSQLDRWVWLGAITLAHCTPQADVAPPPVAVRVEIIARATRGAESRYTGTIRPKAQSNLAFRVAGVVDSIAAVASPGAATGKGQVEPRALQPGDRVVRGMLLAKLRGADYQQRVSETEAMGGETAVSYKKAEVDHERAKKLYAQGAIARADYEGTKARRDGLRGALNASAARTNQTRLLLRETALRSPIDGIVLERQVDAGAVVTAGTPAFVVADVSAVRVVFGVPDNVQSTLASGTSVAVSSDAMPNRVFSATVEKVGAEVDPKTRMFDIEATLDNGEGLFKVGMVTTVRLVERARAPEPPLIIPLGAVVRRDSDRDGFTVYVANAAAGATTVHARGVHLGELLGNSVIVARGLAVGDRIVVQGSTLVSDGATVNIVATEPLAPLAKLGVPAGSSR
jgi:RND family efflux transporter MFP subunit